MVYLPVEDDHTFNHLLATNITKVVIVDFYGNFCAPCKALAPFVKDLADRKPEVVFLTVDIEKCRTTAAANNITSVPTFAAYINGTKMEVITGPSRDSLEAFVNKWAAQGPSASNSPVAGQVDLTPFINAREAECLNEDDKHTLSSLLSGNGRIVSDCDEQLIINLPFNRPVKIHSISIKGPKNEGPKKVKVFANVLSTLDFDKAQGSEPIQTVDFEEGELANLRFVKFQNVKNIQLFVENNKGGGDQTIIEDLKIYGQPVGQATNMDEFKRVSGKAGEGGH